MLLAPLAASAQQVLACEVPAERHLPAGDSEPGAVLDEATLHFEAGAVEAALGEPPTAELSGRVLIRRGDRQAGAERAVYDPQSHAFKLSGGVRDEDPADAVTSTAAAFAYASGCIRFAGADYHLDDSNSRGMDRGV